MNEQLKNLLADSDGMGLYEYIVNNVESCADELPDIIARLIEIDASGQFLASAARFLAAIDRERFYENISALVEATIDKDRERKYIGALLEAVWGKDYRERSEELRESDDNFRRIYKRLFVTRPI